MSQTLIKKAFETRAAAWGAALVPPMPLSFENAPFTPPAPTAANGYGRYARVFVMPGNTDSRDLAGKHREFVGVFQVSLVLAQNKGGAEAQLLAQSLDDAFQPGPPLVQDGFNVWLTSPMSASPPIPEPDRYVIPVSARYKAEAFLSP